MNVRNYFQAETLIHRAIVSSVIQGEPIEVFILEFFEACSLCVGDNQNANKMLEAILKKCESLLSYFKKLSLRTKFEHILRKNRPSALGLILVLQECYKFQVDDPDVVANMMKTVHFYQGDFGLKILFKRRHEPCPDSVCRLKRSVGKRTHSFVGYFNRIATTKKMTFSKRRLDEFLPCFIKGCMDGMILFLCRNIFHFSYRVELEMSYLRAYSNHSKGRHLADLIFEFLPLVVLSFNWNNWSEEREMVVENEITRFQAVHRRMLQELQFFFRTIPDPYVSVKELKDLAESYGAHPLSCALGLKLYKKLLPEISEEPITTPRSLSHLCRCQIRSCLYKAWQLPEAVQTFHFLKTLPRPLPKVLVSFVGLYLNEGDLKQRIFEKTLRNN